MQINEANFWISRWRLRVVKTKATVVWCRGIVIAEARFKFTALKKLKEECDFPMNLWAHTVKFKYS